MRLWLLLWATCICCICCVCWCWSWSWHCWSWLQDWPLIVIITSWCDHLWWSLPLGPAVAPTRCHYYPTFHQPFGNEGWGFTPNYIMLHYIISVSVTVGQMYSKWPCEDAGELKMSVLHQACLQLNLMRSRRRESGIVRWCTVTMKANLSLNAGWITLHQCHPFHLRWQSLCILVMHQIVSSLIHHQFSRNNL